jgi:DNA modification methylase
MKIERILINKLKPATYNPRQISTKQYKDLEESIDKFGLVDPIIVNKDMTIIGGHQRYKIWSEKAKQSSIDDITIPCVVLELNKEEERELNIRLNKSGGEWDFDILANQFDIEELKDWGFKEIELGLNIDKIDVEGNTEDDHIPEVKESRVKLGDVWELGKHRLMCGDSTKESDVNKLMNGEKADMVFTDPPYNVDYDGGSKKREKIKNDKLNDFSQFLNSCFSNMHLFMKGGSCIYVTHSEVERLSFTETFKMVGFQLSSIIIWVKNNSTFSMNKDYKWKHEPIIYGWKKGSHNFYGDNTQDTVWLYDRPSKSKLHPTTKPIELINKAIKNSSKKNEIVLDIFLGSGSTLIACEKTNRVCYGMELDTKYCDVIIERWEQFTGQKAKKITE